MRKEVQLLAYLKSSCPGRQYVARGRKLRDILGISESRLHEMVNHLRQEGHPIGSSQNGYFYAETAGEIYVTIQNLKKMQAGLGAAVRGLEHSLDSFPKGR